MPDGRDRGVIGWGRLALAVLGLAGVLALMLAAARAPGVKGVVWEDFFYQSLVTHVVFAVVIWYLAVMNVVGGIERVRLGASDAETAVARVGLWLASVSLVPLLLPAVFDLGPPLTNNYIPTIVHPLFLIGLAMLGLGVTLGLAGTVSSLPLGPGLDGRAMLVLAIGGVYVLALVAFGWAYARLPAGLDDTTYFERLYWGGGHLLQYVNTGLVLYAWHVLTEKACGSAPLPEPLFKAVAVSLFVLALPALGVMGSFDVLSLEYRNAFTQMLWYGCAPPAVAMVLGVAWRLKGGAVDWRSPAAWALAFSLVLFAAGGVLGYFLGVSDTRTPAHYHAVIGGANIALFGLFFVEVLPRLGLRAVGAKAQKWLYALLGVGQVLQSVGLYWAGAAGVPRKMPGAAQGLDNIEKKMAMGLNGAGALVAVIGGIMFVWLAGRLLFGRGRGETGQ